MGNKIRPFISSLADEITVNPADWDLGFRHIRRYNGPKPEKFGLRETDLEFELIPSAFFGSTVVLVKPLYMQLNRAEQALIKYCINKARELKLQYHLTEIKNGRNNTNNDSE